jgi:hypothetical protein
MFKALTSPNYIRHQAGVIVLCNGDIEYRDGACLYNYDTEILVGAWCEVNTTLSDFRKELSSYDFSSADLPWRLTRGFNLARVVTAQAIREALPSDVGAFYITEETPTELKAPADMAEASGLC